MEREIGIELKDFDTIFVTGHVTAPFSISWSKDDKIALVVDEGVQIFELHPTPLSDQLTITCLRSWIPCSTHLPFRNAVVNNKANSFVWKLNKREVYNMAIDSTLCTIVEKTMVSSFITQCIFSPLICNESYVCCLTNNGVLEIFKWDLRKWKAVVNVSNLWIEYCQFRDNGEDINYSLLKEKLYQMKILTMAWLEKPKPIFVTGHEDGGICIWKVEFTKNSYNMNIHHYFHITGKPSCISFCCTGNQQIIVLIIGTIVGTVKFVVFKATAEMELEKVGNEAELWKHEDFIIPKLIRTEDVGNDKFIFTVKNHVLIIHKLNIDEKGIVDVLKTDWHEFSAPIISFDAYRNNFVIGIRNHEFYTLRVDESGFKVEKDIEVPLKPKHTSCFHCYGLAMSKNKAIWIIVSSAKVNYDPKTVKDTNHLLIFTPKLKTFRSLTDGNYSGLMRSIAETFGSTKMTEISDLLEMKKCELLADPTSFDEETSFDLVNSSPLRLKLLIWECKLRIYTQSAELQNVIAQCEETLVRRWCSQRREYYRESQTELTDLQKRSLDVMEWFLSLEKSDPVAGAECAICGSVAPFTNVKVSSCPNSHSFPRCSLSLLPCDSVPYAFCRLCDSTVLLDFKMKFSMKGSDCGQSRKEKKNDVKRCDISNFRDVNEIKLKLRMRRSKANARERNRMHGLNKALDRLRSTLPIKTLRSEIGMKHKLSKIETLKIACNYIRLLMNILKSDHEMEMNNFANSLAMGLSHTTANVVVSSFHQFSRFYSGSTNSGFGTTVTQHESVSENWSRRLGQ